MPKTVGGSISNDQIWIGNAPCPATERDLAGSQRRKADLGVSCAYEAEPACGTLGQVQDTSLDERAAIVDAHDTRLAVSLIGSLDLAAKPQGAVCCGQAGRVHAFTRSRTGSEGVPEGTAAVLC